MLVNNLNFQMSKVLIISPCWMVWRELLRYLTRTWILMLESLARLTYSCQPNMAFIKWCFSRKMQWMNLVDGRFVFWVKIVRFFTLTKSIVSFTIETKLYRNNMNNCQLQPHLMNWPELRWLLNILCIAV